MMNRNDSKVFVVGIDGGCPELIRDWTEKGELPNIKMLMKDGASGELWSTIFPMTSTAWASFMTGKNPGKHGIFDFIIRERNSYRFYPITSYPRKGEIIWNLIGGMNKRTTIVNVPLTYPPYIANGALISGYPTPESKKDYTFPKELLTEIENEIGDYHIQYKIEFNDNNGREFLDHVKYIVEKRALATKYLMNHKKWDFFMVHFQATDWIQHLFWKYMDENHPDHNSNSPIYLKNAVLSIYRCVDRKIGEFLNELDGETYKIVMSDHGFGCLNKVVYLNNFFRRIGVLHFKKSFKYFLFKLGFTRENIYNSLLKLNLASLIPKYRDKKSEVFRFFLGLSDVNWNRTKVFSVGSNGQIFINLKGREPDGIVENGEEYSRLREEMIRILERLKDPENNQRIFDKIYRKEEVYSGPYAYKAPDIVGLMTRYNQELNFNSTKILGTSPEFLSGYHRMNGFILLNGPEVRKEREVSDVRIVDIAPTILYLMNVPIPEDMDGRPILEAFEENYIKSHQVEYTRYIPKATQKHERLNGELEEEIKRRLKSLGYFS